MEFTGWVGPSYTLDSLIADCQRTVNLYPEVNESGAGKERRIGRFARTSGLKLVVNAGTGPIRGMYTAGNGRVFFVSGNTLYELTAGDVATNRGALDTPVGRVEMADNGIHLVIVTGGTGYAFRFSDNTFVRITDVNFPQATAVQFLDQYLIVDDPATGNFQLSGLADAVNWDGLDIASPEGSPDSLLTLLVDHRELFLFSTQSTEVWFDSGDASFPLARREGAFIEVGIAGRALKAKADSGVFFWGIDKNGGPIAYRINGYNVQRVSTHAIERAVKAYGDISSGTCYTYQRNGHTFWVTNFPGAAVTWVYDIATGLWHERESMSAGVGGRHRAENHCFDGSRNLVGDYENGNVYAFDDATYADNGETIRRYRRAPHVSTENKRQTFAAFQLDIEAGIGNTIDPGSDPQAMLRYSDDGGKTWGNEIWVSIGKKGEYLTQVEWRRLGQGRDRIFEVTISDPVPVNMLGAFLEMELDG